jgi:hypothetical protein
MQELAFYFHEGCLSHQSILLLATELQRDCPRWRIAIHPLLEEEVKALGFQVLPAIVINGITIVTGLPEKGWLLQKMRESERTNGG